MPTETGTAVLIGPAGTKPEAIHASRYKILQQYLDMPEGAACAAIEWLLNRATQTPGLDDQEVLGQSLWHYTNTFDHSLTEGVLASVRGTGEIQDLTAEETKILQDTLMTIRAGGWFREWLQRRVGTIANGEGIPAHRHPTPLEIAASLFNDVEEHKANMEVARIFAQMRPDLVLGATLEPMSTQEQPATSEPTQPATAQRTKSHRTRKAARNAKASA